MMNLTRNKAYLGYALLWLGYCILHLFRLIDYIYETRSREAIFPAIFKRIDEF